MGGVGTGETRRGMARRQRARTEILLHNAVLLSCLFVHGHTRSGSHRAEGRVIFAEARTEQEYVNATVAMHVFRSAMDERAERVSITYAPSKLIITWIF